MDLTHATASNAPLAPRACPTIDFVELILSLVLFSPNNDAIAADSVLSLKGVDVP